MNHEIICCAIYDDKGKKFDTPFWCNNELFAKRHFYLVSAKTGTMINTFLEDFSVFKIGIFNTDDGSFTPEYKLIMTGKELRKQLDSHKVEDVPQS